MRKNEVLKIPYVVAVETRDGVVKKIHNSYVMQPKIINPGKDSRGEDQDKRTA